MKIITKGILLLTLLCSMSTMAYEQESLVSDCRISNIDNFSQTIRETNECAKMELEKQTKSGEILRKPFTPKDIEETVTKVKYIVSSLVLLALFFGAINLVKAQETKYQEEAAKGRSDYLFKVMFVSCLISIMLTPLAATSATRLILDLLNENPSTFYTAMNIQKSQSDTVISSALSSSQTQIMEEVLDVSKSAVSQQTCALGYHQEMISAYAKEDFEVMQSNDEIECIDTFLKENEGKKLSELGYRLLLPAAVFECSYQHNSTIKNCGSIYSKSSIPALNEVVDKYTKEIADFTEDYVGYSCNETFIKDKEDHRTYCTTVRNSEKTILQTTNTLSQIEDNFISINSNFATDFGTVLKDNLKPEEDMVIDAGILDFYGNLNAFLSTRDYDIYYQQVIQKELDKISMLEGMSRNTYDGSSFEDVDSVEVVIEDAEDFVFFTKLRISSLFENSGLLRATMLEDFNFVTDIKLLMGRYTDATETEDFKVDFFPLQRVQEHRNKLIGIGSGLTLYSQYKLNEASAQDRNAPVWEKLNSFAFLVVAVAFFPEIFAFFIAAFTIGGIIFKLIEAISMFAIELFLIYFLKKEPHLLANRFTQLFLAMIIKPITPVIALASGSIFGVVFLEMINYVPIIKDNFAINFVASILIIIGILAFTIKQLLWTNSYLHRTLKTDVEGFKGSVKQQYKNAKNSL